MSCLSHLDIFYRDILESNSQYQFQLKWIFLRLNSHTNWTWSPWVGKKKHLWFQQCRPRNSYLQIWFHHTRPSFIFAVSNGKCSHTLSTPIDQLSTRPLQNLYWTESTGQGCSNLRCLLLNQSMQNLKKCRSCLCQASKSGYNPRLCLS